MNIAEILRGLADKLDSIERPAAGNKTSPNQAELTPVGADHEDHTETSTMISPLQQKQELLKKAAGVESYYDDEHGACEQCGHEPCECEQDPLNVLKQNAGLSVIVQDIGGEENDVLG